MTFHDPPLTPGIGTPGRSAKSVVEAVRHLQPNACDLIHEVAQKEPALLAMVEAKTGQKVTFGELSTTIAKVASRLARAGVRPGDRAAVFVADGPRFIVVVNALFHLGAVPVLIDPGMGVDNVATCIKEQAPRALVGIAKAQALRLLKRAAFASVVVNVVVDSWFPGAVTVSTGAEGDGKDSYQAMHRQRADAPAAVLYTSGSTGAPKGVLYTHSMLMAQSTAIRDMFQIARGDVDVCCFLPFALFSVAMGTTAVFPDMDFRFPAKADPKKILAALRGAAGTKPATSAFGSPALWEPFSHHLAQTGEKLPGLKRLLTAGAPVRPQLHERLMGALPDGDVFTPYGATEALPVAIMGGREVLNETAEKTRAGRGTCVGRLAPGIRVKIVALTDDPIATLADARELPVGEIGEIVVSGPCVTRAYDEVSDRAKEANTRSKILEVAPAVGGDGADPAAASSAPPATPATPATTVWHRMGDAGYLDESGRLWFCGRKSHRVVKGDVTLHSVCVEAVVERGRDQRAALVGVGEKGTQRAVVLIETRNTSLSLPSLDEVKSWPGCAAVDDVREFPGFFPVDRRHNAKIEREKLAVLAAQG